MSFIKMEIFSTLRKAIKTHTHTSTIAGTHYKVIYKTLREQKQLHFLRTDKVMHHVLEPRLLPG